MKFLVQNNQIIEGPLSNYPKTFELEDVIHPIREMANKGHDVTQYGWVEDTTAEPTYDPSTHKLGDTTYSVVDGQVVGEYEVVAIPEDELTAIKMSKSVSMRQARLALLQSGKLADIEAAIAALPEPDKTAVSIEWEYAQDVRRDHTWVQALGAQLGMTDDDLDNLFTLAETL